MWECARADNVPYYEHAMEKVKAVFNDVYEALHKIDRKKWTRVLPRRPKRCRRVDPSEAREKKEKEVAEKAKKASVKGIFKASRHEAVIHCKICGSVGHNVRTCPRKPAVAASSQPAATSSSQPATSIQPRASTQPATASSQPVAATPRPASTQPTRRSSRKKYI
ncbi:hypothetical protein LIER_03005 [Lithospermum erythrorhizon]|uniref:CCHC-type domain-containing protein n=1 Tax=Lithospermum erythrorhizon TaxID=34254 RepID=A0AAV3NS32_LITER